MNCQDFEMIILSLARNQLLDAAIREQGLTHTEVCVRCAVRLAEERALIAGVRSVVAEIARQEAPTRVEAALLAAFREHAAVAASPAIVPITIKTGLWPRWKLGTVAAGILILISMLAIFWLQSSSLSQKREAQVILPVEPQAPPSEPGDPAIDPGHEIADHAVAPRRQGRVRYQTPRHSSGEVEEVTQFFPLMGGDDLSSLERGQIIRVELPGSALIEVGLPVDIEMMNEPVKADVVLGPDGLARAIRFVL